MTAELLLLSTLMGVPTGLDGDTVTLEERIDLYDPSSGAYLGVEHTWYGPEGRRLRLEERDAQDNPTLLFFVRHDSQGRESEAIYFTADSDQATRERFTFSDNGRLQTTTYFYEPGVASERTEIERDASGRDLRKRYYRDDGSQYGDEDVLWDEGGNQLGWDFRYVEREGGASFRYSYEEFDSGGAWIRRVRSRDGTPERREVRTRVTAPTSPSRIVPARFGPGAVSTGDSETSPSFSRDGRTMVFARYGEEWTSKTPYVAYLEDTGWRSEPLSGLGSVYNLAISPDGKTVFFARRGGESRTLFRVHRTQDGWSTPENLTREYGAAGTYPVLSESGDLFVFDSDGAAGGGIYVIPRDSDGFGAAKPVFTPSSGEPFDPYTKDGRRILVTRCFDSACDSGPRNGIWEIVIEEGGEVRELKLTGLPYAWGVQRVESLGLLVFTDGEDILAAPLTSVGVGR